MPDHDRILGNLFPDLFVTWVGNGLAWRVLGLGAAVAVAWLCCFHVLFPRWLRPERAVAPWPRDALGRALAVFWLLACGAGLFFFAVLSDELRPAPPDGRSGGWESLRRHAPWLGVVVTGVLGAALILGLVRHRVPTRQAAAPPPDGGE
jgi:hypothetical protein